jgi:hypothetical protein
MKWSRLGYCAAITALTTFLATRGASLWLTVPIGVFAAWWTFLCTRALWSVASFRVAVWRAHLLPRVEDFRPRKRKRLWWLANPKLDSLTNATTIVGVLCFPALLWLPLIFLLLG